MAYSHSCRFLFIGNIAGGQLLEMLPSHLVTMLLILLVTILIYKALECTPFLYGGLNC